MPLGYSLFAPFYDLSIEWVYRSIRQPVADAAQLRPNARVLELACGTGQGLQALSASVPDGSVVGIDLSAPMLARAQARVDRLGLGNVELRQQDALTLDEPFDAVVVALGMSVIGPWREVFAHTFAQLKPGGRYVIFDVHARKWVPQSYVVEFMAGADLQREVWSPLLEACPDGSLTWLDGSPHIHGGSQLIAAGTKPA